MGCVKRNADESLSDKIARLKDLGTCGVHEMEPAPEVKTVYKLAQCGRSVSVDTVVMGPQSSSKPRKSTGAAMMSLSELGRGGKLMSLSTGHLADLLQESEAGWFHDKVSNEERIRIELEGDGPLGLTFAENHANDIVVHHIRRGTASSEFTDLEQGLVLRAIDDSTEAVADGYQSAVDAVAASWRASSEVVLLFARPRRSAAPSPPCTPASCPASAAGFASETKRERNLRQVQEFLRDLKVDGYMSAFVEFGVSSMEDLHFIEPTDLPAFGLKPLQQRRVMAALTRLKAAGGQ